MAKTFRWTNQYIGLIETKPDYIAMMRTPEDVPAVRQHIKARANGRPLVVELGCGSGGHLVERAAKDPSRLYVGIELRFKRVFMGARKGEHQDLSNVLIIQGDAEKLEELFDPNSVDTLYVQFPDPWAKARWRKHRLLKAPFLATIFRVLTMGGYFRFKSDHEEYFNEAVALLQQMHGVKMLALTHNLYADASLLEDNVASEFESLFRHQGLPIHLAIAQKFQDAQ